MSSGVYGYSREAVRIKVKKIEPGQPQELRKFSVDPQITSFEVLQSILGKAFNLKGDFAICYRLYDVNGYETYLPLLSDWDLDAAFLKAYNMSVGSNSDPCLCLRVDLKPFEESSDDWELKQNVSVITQIRTPTCQEAKPSPRLHGIFNQVGKTLNLVQRAFLGDDGTSPLQPPRPPLSDSEFRTFLDPVGQVIYAKELRNVIYLGGIEPSLRKVVWKHLLNVYPEGMTGRERMDYIKKKATEYINLREVWKAAILQGPVVGELAYTTGMVRKDVLRTDRHLPFYAGNDDNQNIAQLFNILTTYALNHPKVSYCQGMSDLASPLLVTMGDEAHAYICFCALMQRLSSNFILDGIAMTQKFTHLAEGLMYYDPEFYNYLKLHQADDLLFCYRWLLLEMKREFAFEDSLRMLEVLWSSLPPYPPDTELKLFDVHFQPITTTPPISPLVKTPRENPYTKVCALRRQSSSMSLNNSASKKPNVKRQNHSLDETSSLAKNPISETKTKHQSLDDGALTRQKRQQTELRPRSVSPLEAKSDSFVICNGVGNGKKSVLSTSMTNLVRPSKKSHFKELKERVGSKFFSSLERLDNDDQPRPKTKMVKNLNEFLNFAAGGNKNKISDRCNEAKPKILLTRSSFDDSEKSSEVTKGSSNDDTFDDCSPEEYFPLTNELRLDSENLDRKIFGDKFIERLSTSESKLEEKRDDVFLWENPLLTKSPEEQAELEFESTKKKCERVTPCEEVTEVMKTTPLPSPQEFGGGNPFLMFLCITVLLQHRNHIMTLGMDYNEMAMHFDKMVRKHDVTKVLNQARQMHARYIKQNTIAQQKQNC